MHLSLYKLWGKPSEDKKTIFKTPETSNFLHHWPFTTQTHPFPAFLWEYSPIKTSPMYKVYIYRYGIYFISHHRKNKETKIIFTRSAEREGETSWAIIVKAAVLEGHIALLPPNNSMKNGCISPIVISYLSHIRPPSSTSITPWKIGGWNLKIAFLLQRKIIWTISPPWFRSKPLIFKVVFMGTER